MRKHLHHDIKKLMYTKKYVTIMIALLLISLLYAVFLSQKDMSSLTIFTAGMAQYRPFYWFLCCYFICDILAGDFHYKMWKTTIPLFHSRISYLLSKCLVAIAICCLSLLACMLGLLTIAGIHASANEWIALGKAAAWSFGGAGIASSVFVSLILLCTVLVKNEAVTIGMSMGTIILLLIMESIQAIERFVPTMQMVTLQATMETSLYEGMVIIGAMLIATLLLTWGSVRLFKQMNLYT